MEPSNGKTSTEPYPETPFAKEVRTFVEGLHGSVLELGQPIIGDEKIIGYACKVRLLMQTSYMEGETKIIRQTKYAANYAHFYCIEQAKAFIDESERLAFRFYLKTIEFEASESDE